MPIIAFEIPRVDGDKITITKKTDIVITIDKEVVLSSIKVLYYHWVSVNITNRIKKYIKGNTINLSGANYAKGTHKLEISGKMNNGADFKQQLEINVV